MNTCTSLSEQGSEARSTPLNELGLAPDEMQRLEQVGVRNLAQLQKLGASTGVRL